MLSKNDKKWIKETIQQIIQQELKEALTIEIQYEKFDKKRGIKELKTEKHFLPEWLAYYQPELIGAIQGMQVDIGKARNKMIGTAENVRLLIEIISQAEQFLDYKFVPGTVKEIIKEEVAQIENKDS